ncbi:MAG: hypothetical protein ACUVXI_16815 [bacterium]
MAVNPVDLQVLFLGSNIVGMQEATMQARPIRDVIAFSEDVDRLSVVNSRSVQSSNPTHEIAPLSDTRREISETAAGRQRRHREEAMGREEGSWHDPRLGNNLDLWA